MTSELLQPFYDYMDQRRRILLDELEQIERLIGVSPRTSEIRRRYKSQQAPIAINEGDAVAGVISQSVETTT